jgi:hypothetical protein
MNRFCQAGLIHAAQLSGIIKGPSSDAKAILSRHSASGKSHPQARANSADNFGKGW